MQAVWCCWCCLFVGGGEREQGTGCLQARSGSLSASASRAYCSVSFLLACMMSPAPMLPFCDSAPGAQHTCIWAAGARGAFAANPAHAGAAMQAAPLAWPSPALGPSTQVVGLGWRGPSRCRRRWRRRPARLPEAGATQQPWGPPERPGIDLSGGVAACPHWALAFPEGVNVGVAGHPTLTARCRSHLSPGQVAATSPGPD